MYVIVGGTGHVGSATAKALLKAGQSVTVVTRDADNARHLDRLGARVAVVDLHDIGAMRNVVGAGRSLFLLNPPAAPDTNTDATEKATIGKLLAAIEGADLDLIVAQSTYGAQDGDRIGDLNTLWTLEQGLEAAGHPHAIIRAAYYFSNWDVTLGPARTDGVLPTMYPADLKLPMVAPDDLGAAAAQLLINGPGNTRIHHVEGPERYSSRDVANAFATALGRQVEPMVTPRDQWEEGYRKLGFSAEAARS